MPTIITELSGKNVVKLAIGSHYCAAVTSNGQLYTWGSGSCGKLGHGSCDDVTVPTLVATLKPVKIVEVCCGTGDAHTLAVTEAGKIKILVKYCELFMSKTIALTK